MKNSLIALIALLFIGIGLFYSCKKETVDLDVNQLAAVWKLHAFIDENNNKLDTPDIQISFTEDNCITVFTSSNYGQGQFNINGNNITVQGLTLTDRPYDLQNDKRFIENLSGSYLITGDTLRILSDNNIDIVLVKTQLTDPYQCDISARLTNKINSNRYQPEDIFHPEYSAIYGKWFLSSFYGGWAGGENQPHFDFLEVKKNGIYGIINGFELVEYGKIEMKKLTEELLLLKFIPTYKSGEFPWSFSSERRLTFPVNDTLILQANCLDCYHYRFYRIE